MDKRPPPYFPQSSLNPADDKRYRKFKLIVAAGIIFLIVLLAGAGYGVYYFVNRLF